MSKRPNACNSWQQVLYKHVKIINTNKTINIKDSSSDSDIQIVVVDKKPREQIKIVPIPKPKLQPGQLLLEFKNRIKSCAQKKQRQAQQKSLYEDINGIPKKISKQQINLDGDQEQIIKTRSRGSAKLFNQPNQKLLEDDRQFKLGKYEYNSKASKLQQKKTPSPFTQNVRRVGNQSNYFAQKAKAVDLQKMSNYINEYRIPKKGQSIYPPKKAIQKETSGFGRFQMKMVSNDRDRQSLKIKEQKKKMLQIKKLRKKQQDKVEMEKRRKQIQSKFQSLLGIQPEKPTKQNQEHSFQNICNQPQDGLNNIEMLQKIQEEAQGMRMMNQEYFQYEDRTKLVKKAKYGLNQIVKPYDTSNALPFVKAILSHKFSADLMTPQTKRIPNVFKQSSTYQKTFHYLVINECIADLHQRMKKAQKGECQKLVTQILNIQNNSHVGMTQITLRELKDPKQNGQQKFMLRNYSLSKNRLGLLTNQKHFKFQHYGISTKSTDSKDMKFAILCLLKCPENKKDLKQDVKVLTTIKNSELELIVRNTGNMTYFYDFQKLSTNMREYMSISNIQYSELSHIIYNPMCMENQLLSYVSSEHKESIRDILGVLQNQFNRTQYESIRQMVLRQQGIVLLQGPPGTGKTSTLLGLLSAQYQFLKKVGDNRKIMICGPSNASVDHIAKRIITQGLVAGDGQVMNPMVLRVGIVQTQDKDILRHSLDHICQQNLVGLRNQQLKDAKMTTVQIRQKLQSTQKQLRHLINKQSKANNYKNASKQQMDKILNQLTQKRKELIYYENMLFSFRRQKIVSRKYYNQIESKLMEEAQIIITTLSSSGSDKIEKIRGEIACLIVDEAAQATQPNLLIALQTGVKKVLLIGDPCQLPATTLSPDSNNTLFNRSLFERFIDSGIRPYFLNIQYRMTPLIRQFPSKKFYQNRLIDGQNIKQREIPQVLQFLSKRTNIFIDLKYGAQEKVDNSYSNLDQALFIIDLLKSFKLLQSDISIGIITPYQSQRKLLNRRISPLLQDIQKRPNLMINTIDSFQGQQKDLIIISAVRSNMTKKIGFLLDERRINVSLTRAKHCMIVIGNGDTLGSNQVWNDYFQLIQSKKLYFDVHTNKQGNDLIKKLSKQDHFNQKSIRRRIYQKSKMTFDLRKISRNQINQEDFKKSKNKKKQVEQPNDNKPTQQNEQAKILANNNCISKSPEYSQKINNSMVKSPEYQSLARKSPEYNPYSAANTNYMIAEDQMNEIIAKKRKKQEEIYKFQQVCSNLKQVEKQKKNDEFYKFLFQ